MKRFIFVTAAVILGVSMLMFGSAPQQPAPPAPPGEVIALVEFKGIDRKPLQMQIADPNALILRFRVRGIDALAARIKAAGTKVASLSGGPYANGQTRWLMVQGPDNVFVQLTEAPPNAPNPGAPALPR